LTFSGRIVSGSEGFDSGWSLGLPKIRSAALALADEIAQKSPDAVRAAKRLYDKPWTSNDTRLL
jgi:hypothetical protein